MGGGSSRIHPIDAAPAKYATALFRRLDTDNDKTLSLEELAAATGADPDIARRWPDERIQEQMKAFDMNHDNHLDEKEWADAFKSLSSSVPFGGHSPRREEGSSTPLATACPIVSNVAVLGLEDACGVGVGSLKRTVLSPLQHLGVLWLSTDAVVQHRRNAVHSQLFQGCRAPHGT